MTADPVQGSPPPLTEGEETDLEPSPRRWGKIVFWVVAALVVVLIVTLIWHNSPGQTPNQTLNRPATQTTVTSGSAAKTSTPTVGDVSSDSLTKFGTATRSLDAANVTVSHALASRNTLTVAQVSQAVSPYVTALENFDFTLHLTTWPPSMQVPTEDLMLRNQALVSFLQSSSSETQGALPSWFSQLHALGSRAETADNQVRKDLGLSTTTSYP